MPYSNEELLKMYGQMVLGRRYVEKIVELVSKGKLVGFFHLGFGQEAIGVGINSAMGPEDYLVPTHRQQTVLVNRLDINKFTAELIGKATGYCKGKGFEFHISSPEHRLFPISAVLGSGGPLGVGAAMALRLDKKSGVVVCCCGEGAASEGNIHEAMNIASIFKLPIVFAIENNGWAISQPAARQYAASALSVRAAGYGMSGVTIDGNDLLTVRETIEKAIEAARNGKPNVVEMKATRWRGHFEGDPHQIYRDMKEIEEAKKDDCIIRYGNYLLEQKLLTEKDIAEISEKMRQKVEDAFAYAESSPYPTEEEILDHKQVYAGYFGGEL